MCPLSILHTHTLLTLVSYSLSLSTHSITKVEELEEILQPEQIVYHTIHKGPQGKKFYKYLVKFKNYSVLHAKWMDEDMLSDHPEILDIYKQAFQLRSTD